MANCCRWRHTGFFQQVRIRYRICPIDFCFVQNVECEMRQCMDVGVCNPESGECASHDATCSEASEAKGLFSESPGKIYRGNSVTYTTDKQEFGFLPRRGATQQTSQRTDSRISDFSRSSRVPSGSGCQTVQKFQPPAAPRPDFGQQKILGSGSGLRRPKKKRSRRQFLKNRVFCCLLFLLYKLGNERESQL